MDIHNILFVFSFIILLLILFMDLYFYNLKHPLFLTNQAHINMYLIPFAVSYSLFLISITDDEVKAVFAIIILVMFAILYIAMIGTYKIVLRDADIEEVIEKFSEFLESQNKVFRIYKVTEHSYDVEINNFSKSFIIRNKEKWVEIETNIHTDDELLINLDNYFKLKSHEMRPLRLRPNIFFYLIIIFTLTMFFFLSKYFF